MWTPYPFKAGFCITDDTDAASFDEIKTIYEFLKSLRLVTTKTVWPFKPIEPCGIPPTPVSTLRGVTFENKAYLDYCMDLSHNGFEICLHGASAGNNTRDRTLRAIAFMKEYFGYVDTFICHAKNAENIYWEEKVIPYGILQKVLRPISRYTCYGEQERSKYFWGDLCYTNIKQIRLFRTRGMDTQKINPSMPYFDVSKPFVKSWFSATKRSFSDCTSNESLTSLKQGNGLTILYQYLHRYVCLDSMTIDEKFREGAYRLANDDYIWIDTVRNIMQRLRLIQGIFIVYRGNMLYVINTNDQRVDNLQIEMGGRKISANYGENIRSERSVVIISSIDKRNFVKISTDRAIKCRGLRCAELDRSLHGVIHFGGGVLYVNMGDTAWYALNEYCLKPHSCVLTYPSHLRKIRPLSVIRNAEYINLIYQQTSIIIREIVWKGRSINAQKFLSGDKIRLEDHGEW